MRFEPFHINLLKRYIESQQVLRPDAGSEVLVAEGGIAIYDALGLDTRLILEDTIDCGEIVLTLLRWLAARTPSVRMDLSPLTMGVTPDDLREMGCEEKSGCQIFVRATDGHDLFRAPAADLSLEWAQGERLEETLHVIGRAFAEGEEPTRDMVDAGRAYAKLGEYVAILLEDDVIAGGGLFVEGDTAYLSAGSVLPAYRGKHLHSVLIRERLRRARELGATTAWVSSAPGGRSERNLLRAGFSKAYTRDHFVFRR